MADKARILIVDDDEDYRASTRAMLEAEGYEVIEADSGSAGVDAARSQRPNLIVLDIMMESPIEGYNVVQALKHCGGADIEEIPIVMVSSVRDDPSTIFPMAGDLPMITPDAYFAKPLDYPKFLEMVRQMIES